MKLLFRQRMFSWFDSYDVYYESGAVAYTVKGQLSWGHCLKVFDAQGDHVATVQEKLFTILPEFELYVGDRLFSTLCKQWALFRSRYYFAGGPEWEMEGDWLGWDYSLTDPTGRTVATFTKEIWNWTDTYSIQVEDPSDALTALMAAIAIDAEKCSNNS